MHQTRYDNSALIYSMLIFLLMTMLSACNTNNQPASSTTTPTSSTTSATQSVKVVATTGMIADIASTIGADCTSTQAMMGPGVDPHLYKASASDVRMLQNADIIFYSGLHLEGQLGEIFENLSTERPVIAVAEAATEDDERIATNDRYGVDPHIWMDASLWAKTSDVIASELSKLAPDCSQAFAERASSLKSEILALHDWVGSSVATIPEQQRILVTAHDAFAYYSRAYHIDVAGIQGISTESEASIADIQETVNTVVERRVPALFIESSINPRSIEAVQAAVQDRGFEVSIGAQLFSDAMGTAGTAEGTYIGMIYNNTRHIVEALGGNVAALPEGLAAWSAQWGVK